MFTLEKECIHVCSAYQSSVYIINLIYRSVRWFALVKVRTNAGSTPGSSVYLIKYVSVVFVCYCRVLGSGGSIKLIVKGIDSESDD